MNGRVLGGHVAHGCIVRTTAEVLLALPPAWQFSRETDPATGYAEFVVSPRADRQSRSEAQRASRLEHVRPI